MHWSDPPENRHDVITIPILWVAIVLSLLVHVAALWLAWPHLHLLTPDQGKPDQSSSLAVQLTPPTRETRPSPPAAPSTPSIASAAPRPPETVSPPRPPRARPVPPRRQGPPVIASKRNREITVPPPAPPVVAPPVAAPPAPTPAPAPAPSAKPPPVMEGDLASYVEARRRARGEATQSSPASTSSAESEKERLNRMVAENLGLNRTPTFNYDPRSAGGIFQITHIGYDDAQFWFFGLDKDIGRNAKQLIDVRKGGDRDIRVAIVHKMIEIIRQNVTGDFLWTSQRTGRQVQLSARPSDSAGLEDYILRDVFPETRGP